MALQVILEELRTCAVPCWQPLKVSYTRPSALADFPDVTLSACRSGRGTLGLMLLRQIDQDVEVAR